MRSGLLLQWVIWEWSSSDSYETLLPLPTDNDLQGSDGSGSLGGPDVRRRIPIKLISKQPLRTKPPPRTQRPGSRQPKLEAGEDGKLILHTHGAIKVDQEHSDEEKKYIMLYVININLNVVLQMNNSITTKHVSSIQLLIEINTECWKTVKKEDFAYNFFLIISKKAYKG